MTLACVSRGFAFMTRFFQVDIQLTFGLTAPLADGPQLLGGGVAPVFNRRV
jgi:hypothetical protein